MHIHEHKVNIFPKDFPRNLGKLPKAIKILSFLMFTYFLGWGIANPFISIFFEQKFGSYTIVGVLNALLYILPVIWVIPLGYILDKISKKNFLKNVFLVYIPIGILFASIKTLAHAILVRVYQAILASSLWTTTEIYMRSHSSKNKTAECVGLYDFGFGSAAVLGGILSGFIFLKIGFKIFYIVSLFCFLAFIVTWKFLPDHTKRIGMIKAFKKLKKQSIFKKEIKEWYENKKLRNYTIMGFFVHFCYVFFLILLPLFLKFLNATPIIIGVVYGLFYVPVLFETFSSTIADRIGRKKVMRLGLMMVAIFFIALFFTTKIWMTAVFAFMLALSFSLVIPSMEGKITTMIKGRKVGELTAITRSIKSIGGGLGPLIAGVISDVFGLRYIFLMGVVIFGGLLIFFNAITRYKAQKTPK